MMLRLVLQELRVVRRDRRATRAVLALAALLLLCFAALSLGNARDNAEKTIVAAAERQRWLNQGEGDAHGAAHYSIFAFKPTPALAALDAGLSGFVGQTVWLEAHHQDDMLYRPQQDAAALQRAGLLSPGFLLVDVAPLAAFLLTFAMVLQDRERGTLRLALATARSPRHVLLGKFLAAWGLLTAGLVVPSLVAAAASAGTDADLWLRLGGWALLMTGWLGFLVAVGFAVAVCMSRAREAMAVLFGVWLVFALVLPRAAGTYVDEAVPLPSTQAIKQSLLERAPAYWSPEARQEHYATLFQTYGVARKEDLPVDARGAELDLAERRSHAVFDEVLGGLYDRVEAQDRLFGWLGFLSPAIAVRALSTGLAGTDFHQHRDFIVQAESYRRALVNRMNEEVARHPLNHDEARRREDVALWSQVPEFSYAPPRLRSVVPTLGPALFAYAAWLGVAVALLLASAHRVRP